MTNHALPDLRNHRGKLLAVCLGALSLGLPSSAADVSSQPLAWIHFSRSDKDISLFNGYPMYFVSGGGLEVHLDADPDPEHSLAFMWLCKENPGRGSSRSMKGAVNGNETVRTHPAVEERESTFFWDVVPVSTFGINQLDYDRPKVVPLNITEPLALLAIHGCRTGEFEKIPSWVSIGMAHYAVIREQEIWFDRPKLENYYEDRKDYIKSRGFVVKEDWFPGE